MSCAFESGLGSCEPLAHVSCACMMPMFFSALQKNTEKASESTNEAQESKLAKCNSVDI